MLINEISKEKVCSICLEDDKNWHLYDCNSAELPIPSEKRIFSSAMKLHYQNKRGDKRSDISTVWILVCTTEDNEYICMQVGRTKDLKNALDEIKENVKKFFDPEDKKYGKLKNRNYKELAFYEVDIDMYLEKDSFFVNMYGNKPDDKYLSGAYYFIRAAYVEGKIGAETGADAYMYHKSSLDEYFYEYVKEVILKHNVNERK